MKSVASILAGAAALSQVASAFSIGRHAHGLKHVHSRRAAEAAPEAGIDFMEPTDVSYLQKVGIVIGKNKPVSSGSGVGVGQGDEYVVELNNKSPEDIIVVSWSGKGQWGAVTAGFVGAAQADITHTLKANTTTYFSYSPSKYGGDISGALAPVYPGGGLTKFSGQVDDTWVEFTFTAESSYSTTDVSRLINMNGHNVEVHNYADKADKDGKKAPVCSSTKDLCSFVCPTGVQNCIVGKIIGCPVGKAGTMSNVEGSEGGCGGMGNKKGYVVVDFFGEKN